MQGKMKCGRRAGKRRIVRKHGDSENYFNCDFYSDVYCPDSSCTDAEGKDAGLGAIAGGAETYWGKNKGRSMEGLLVKITKWLAIGFMVVAVILNITRIWG